MGYCEDSTTAEYVKIYTDQYMAPNTSSVRVEQELLCLVHQALPPRQEPSWRKMIPISSGNSYTCMPQGRKKESVASVWVHFLATSPLL